MTGVSKPFTHKKTAEYRNRLGDFLSQQYVMIENAVFQHYKEFSGG